MPLFQWEKNRLNYFYPSFIIFQVYCIFFILIIITRLIHFGRCIFFPGYGISILADLLDFASLALLVRLLNFETFTFLVRLLILLV